MGLLSKGKPLSWAEAKEQADYVREQGIVQFLEQYSKVRHRHGDYLLWGDEVVNGIDFNCLIFDRLST